MGLPAVGKSWQLRRPTRRISPRIQLAQSKSQGLLARLLTHRGEAQQFFETVKITSLILSRVLQRFLNADLCSLSTHEQSLARTASLLFPGNKGEALTFQK